MKSNDNLNGRQRLLKRWERYVRSFYCTIIWKIPCCSLFLEKIRKKR
ncbi:hypothetical protein HMPREF1349_01581 [Enterococcus faecium 506]|nr:hypothetical protein HMPREF1349_01581 [Enterococcus faecium 506]